MKRLLIFLLCTVSVIAGSGQTIGGNGQGLMDFSKQADWDLLRALDFTFIVRYPGGADTKFAFTDTKGAELGWDFSLDTIEAHYAKFGTDENDSDDGLEKYRKKYADQEKLKRAHWQRLSDLNDYVPNHLTMFNFNVFYRGKDKSMRVLDSLIASGVRVPAVVFNNEVYSKGQYQFNFEEYRADFEPWAELIRSRYPDIAIGLCMAPNVDRNDHTAWNNALFDYIEEHPGLIDAVDIHLYYNQEQLPLSWAKMPTTKQVISMTQENTALDDAWQTFYDETKANTMIEDRVAYIRGRNPDVRIWCSEWNANPMSKWSNTVAHGAFIFRKFMENAPQFEYLMVHNTIGSDIGSSISKRQEQDDVPLTDTNVVRVHFYSLMFAGTCLKNSAVEVSQLSITEPGTYYAWYAQIGDERTYPNFNVSGDMKITSLTNVYVAGEYSYSSAGVLSLMPKVRDGQAKTYAVDGFYVTDENFMEANSFGFFTIQIEPTYTVVCSDTTLLAGYADSVVVDTVDRPECAKCGRFFHRIFNRKICASCELSGGVSIIETVIQVPVFVDTVLCDTILETGMVPPAALEGLKMNYAFRGDLSNDLPSGGIKTLPVGCLLNPERRY